MARRSFFEIKGMFELEQKIRQLDRLPQRVVTKAARQGANVSLKSARADAPYETGHLKKGIILKPERSKRLKKVYQVIMNPADNDIFVKTTKDGRTRYYYPASQEYGFITKDGGYFPGAHFLKKSLTRNVRAIREKVMTVATKEVEKILKG